MSLFYITVPTREYEVILRQKELDVHDIRLDDRSLVPQRSGIHQKVGSDTSVLSIDVGNPPPATTDIYIAKAGGIEKEIFVSDDFMEVKEKTDDNHSGHSRRSGTNLTDDKSIEAEISKYFLEKHLEDTLDKYDLSSSATWSVSYGRKMSQISFAVPSHFSDVIIRRLHSVGVGVKYGSSIAVCSVDVYYGPTKKFMDNKSAHNLHENGEESMVRVGSGAIGMEENKQNSSGWADFVKSIKSRLTVAQVVSQVKANADITFDYLMLVLVAGTIACLGLLDNSSVILVASMLISPLMGPIMALVFGTTIRDTPLFKQGLRSELIGLFICLSVGFLAGITLAIEAFKGPWAGVAKWPTSEMEVRGQPHGSIVGVLMAIPSGIGVAMSTLAGNAGSLVGVAIAASLLPPAVNCVGGLFWGLSLTYWFREAKRSGHWIASCGEHLKRVKNDTDQSQLYRRDYELRYCNNPIWEYFCLGSVSFGLTMINIVIIFVVAILILKIKEVAPYTTRKSLRRFWQEDLAYTRKYNKMHHDHDITAAIVDDINNAEDPEEVQKRLEQDQVMKQVNRNIGGVGGATILKEFKEKASLHIVGSEILLPRLKAKTATREEISEVKPPPKGNWLSNWLAKF